MQKLIITCTNRGMVRDIGISQLTKEVSYAYENRNIRITAVNDDTLYTVTNEKGTKSTNVLLQGTYLGSCTLNLYIIVFSYNSSNNTEYIYRLYYDEVNDTYVNDILYSNTSNALGFSLDYPIEAIGYYESEEIQKVYWVDGLNPNRFINIANTKDGNPPEYSEGNAFQFNFLGRINNIPKVDITKNYSKAGNFLAGVMQYFITYYNKYGIETPIIWQSDLQYITFPDRGAKPEELVSCTFDFRITNLDTNYNYIRIYATYRAALNGALDGRLIAEIPVSDSITYSDYGTNYQSLNPTDLFYTGGLNIIASTIDYKQDTLFLGDIKIANQQDYSYLELIILSRRNIYKTYEDITINECGDIKWEYKRSSESFPDKITEYSNLMLFSQLDIAGFKYREFYRFGIQFMSQEGEWTPAFWLGDKYCDLPPAELDASDSDRISLGITYYLDDNKTKYFAPFVSIYNEDGTSLPYYYIIAPESSYGSKMYFYGYYHSGWASSDSLEYTVEESINFRGNLTKLDKDVDTTSYDLLYEEMTEDTTKKYYYIANAIYTIPEELKELGYTQYRLLTAESNLSTRRIITQGVINPTMFNFKLREDNQPYSINSWLFRPRNSKLAHSHYDSIPVQTSTYAEILGIMSKEIPGYNNNPITGEDSYDSFFLIFAPNQGKKVMYKLVYYDVDSGGDLNLRDYINSDFTSDYFYDEDSEGNKVLNFQELYNVNGTGILSGREAALVKTKLNNYLKEGKNPISYDFQNYKIISLGFINKTRWEDTATSMTSQIIEDLKSNNLTTVFSSNMLPSGDELKEAANEGSNTEVWIYLGLAVALAASIVATVFSFGAAAPAIAGVATGIATVTSALAYSAAAGASVLAAIGSSAAISAVAENEKYNENAKDIDKVLSRKGIYSILPSHSLSDRKKGNVFANNLLDLVFYDYISQDSYFSFDPGVTTDLFGQNANFYAMGGTLTFESEKELSKNNKQASYYIDESIVTLNSPDIDSLNMLENSSAYKLDLIGTITVDSVINDYTMYAELGLSSTAKVLNGLYKTSYSSINVEGMVNGYLYLDTIWPQDTPQDIELHVNAAVLPYKIFMWNRDTSWSTWMPDVKIIDPFSTSDNITYISTPPAKPIKKIFANWKYSKQTSYKNNSFSLDINDLLLYNSDTASIQNMKHLGKNVLYCGNVDTVVIPPADYTLIAGSDNAYTEFYYYTNSLGEQVVGGQCKDPISIRYKTAPHIVISLALKNGDIQLLPTIGKEVAPSLDSFYPDELRNLSALDLSYYEIANSKLELRTSRTVLTFNREHISNNMGWESNSSPYLFLGEIVKKEFNYDDWYGGTTELALQLINWNVCSLTTPINEDITKSWGDTYYLRWECLKTYPYTEEEVNGNVEVLSFMLESHVNLDGRSDINRGVHNLINLRPANTNLFNNVYNQADNFFNYKILDDKFDKSEFTNQIVWSLSKTNVDNIDKWTSISAVNTLLLDGKLGKINKVINVNDSVLVFQDTGISAIQYNTLAALSTYEGLPLQMGNTGKVTGYIKVSDLIGCHNKWAINLSNAGVFFIDSYNKSLYLYTNNSITDIGSTYHFSTWFKDNIDNDVWKPNGTSYKLNYDALTQDLYINNKNTCLVYNVKLQAFTSFMNYINTPLIINTKGKSLAFQQDYNSVNLWGMFEGNYSEIYGKFTPYSIEYRISPSPYTDNVFTNYEFTADWTNPTTKSSGIWQIDTELRSNVTFDTIIAKNEYQLGEAYIGDTSRLGKHDLKRKFRLWKGNIPRDGEGLDVKKLKGDRMRNPWINLKFTKEENNNNEKMTFHNLNVIYYN